jgi:hypothetical protein
VSRPQSAGSTRMKKPRVGGTFGRSSRNKDGVRPASRHTERINRQLPTGSSFRHNQNMTMQDIIVHGPTHIDRSIIRPASAANQRLRERNLEGEDLLMSKSERDQNEVYLQVGAVERERMQLIERQLDMKRRTVLQNRRVALERKAGVRAKSRCQHGVNPFFNSMTDTKIEDAYLREDGYNPIFRQPHLTATIKAPIRPVVTEHMEDRSKSIHPHNWRPVGRTDLAAYHSNLGWKDPYKSMVAFMRISAKTGVNLDEIAEHERKRKQRTHSIRASFRKQKRHNDVKTAHIEAVFSRPAALLKARSIARMEQRGEYEALALTNNLSEAARQRLALTSDSGSVDQLPPHRSPSSALSPFSLSSLPADSTAQKESPAVRPGSAVVANQTQATQKTQRQAALNRRPASAATVRPGKRGPALADTRNIHQFNNSNDAIVTRVRSRPVSALASSCASEVIVRTGDVHTRDGRVLRGVTVPQLSERMEMIALPKPFRETPCHPLPVTLATDSTEIDLKGLNVPEDLRVANRNAAISPLRHGCSVCALKKEQAEHTKTREGKIIPALVVHDSDEVVRYFHDQNSMHAARRTNKYSYNLGRADGHLLMVEAKGEKMARPLTSSVVLSEGLRAHDTSKSVTRDIDDFTRRLAHSNWNTASRQHY